MEHAGEAHRLLESGDVHEKLILDLASWTGRQPNRQAGDHD
jgi:hypothetical protein